MCAMFYGHMISRNLYLIVFSTYHLVGIRPISTQQICIVHLDLTAEPKMGSNGMGVDQAG